MNYISKVGGVMDIDNKLQVMDKNIKDMDDKYQIMSVQLTMLSTSFEYVKKQLDSVQEGIEHITEAFNSQQNQHFLEEKACKISIMAEVEKKNDRVWAELEKIRNHQSRNDIKIAAWGGGITVLVFLSTIIIKFVKF